MPRYHFNVEDGASFPDAVGVELPNLRAARMEAVRLSGKLLFDEPDVFWASGDSWEMIVTDPKGVILFTLRFAAVDAPQIPTVYQSRDAALPPGPFAEPSTAR